MNTTKINKSKKILIAQTGLFSIKFHNIDCPQQNAFIFKQQITIPVKIEERVAQCTRIPPLRDLRRVRYTQPSTASREIVSAFWTHDFQVAIEQPYGCTKAHPRENIRNKSKTCKILCKIHNWVCFPEWKNG